jgi:hypothetical protein
VGDLPHLTAPVCVLDVEVRVAVAREDDLAPTRRKDRITVVGAAGDEGSVEAGRSALLASLIVGIVWPSGTCRSWWKGWSPGRT